LHFDPTEADVKYCGIDLHSNNSVVIVSDEEDRIVFSKRLPNDLGQIGGALEPVVSKYSIDTAHAASR
jgi:hypothetical protein